MVLGAAVPADAASVAVTPMLTIAQFDSVSCRIVNTGTAAITVRIELRDENGDDYFDDEGVVVPPGTMKSRGVYVPYVIHAYCRFSGAFNKAYVRASINVYDIGEGRTAVMAHAE
jgi:hypothetical protein